jgi:hypothetical protein
MHANVMVSCVVLARGKNRLSVCISRSRSCWRLGPSFVGRVTLAIRGVKCGPFSQHVRRRGCAEAGHSPVVWRKLEIVLDTIRQIRVYDI